MMMLMRNNMFDDNNTATLHSRTDNNNNAFPSARGPGALLALCAVLARPLLAGPEGNNVYIYIYIYKCM